MRYLTIDILRFLALVCVVYHHTTVKMRPESFWEILPFNLISSFQMPLLFVIAGFVAYYSLNKNWNNLGKWVGKRVYMLLLPHFLFNAVLYPFSRTDLTVWEDLTRVSSYGEWLRLSALYDYGEWFLWAIFFTLLMLIGIHWLQIKLCPEKFVIACTLVVLVALGWRTVPDNFLRVCQIQYYFVWTLVGYLVAHYEVLKHFNLKSLWRTAIVSTIAYIGVLFLSGGHGGWNGPVPITLISSPYHLAVSYMLALTALPLVILVAHLLSRIPGVSSTLGRLGGVTMGIYLFSLLFTKVGIGSNILTYVVGSLTTAIVLSYVARFLIRRISTFVGVRA